MNGLELLADSGPVAGLVGIVGWLLRRLTATVLAEVRALRADVKAMRDDLVEHIAEDDKRHEGVRAGLRQMWRHLGVERASSDERPS